MTTKQPEERKAITSILDNDLYKFTMQRAVLQHYKEVQVHYQFKNRNENYRLNAQAIDWLEKQIKYMACLKLTPVERNFLSQLPYFDDAYLAFLDNFRYRPEEQVKVRYDAETNSFDLSIEGLWVETILYEVPLLALVSEAYFLFVDKDWSHDGQEAKAEEKGRDLLLNGCVFSEFGTRRRRDLKTHDIVVRSLKKAFIQYKADCEVKGIKPDGALSGTSNVHLAKEYGLEPIGTLAHEFFMGVSALEGLDHANRKTLNRWHETYGGRLSIALTDTFTTALFLKDFTEDLANKYIGVRHDSGDPSIFLKTMVNHFKSLDIDPMTKILVFSDSLNVERAIDLKKQAQEAGAKVSFGIGTSFTNDFVKMSNPTEKSNAMNIVIKLKDCNEVPVYKLSDDAEKQSGDTETIQKFKAKLGI